MRGPSLPTGSHSLGFMRAGSSRGIDASLTEIPFPSRFANITATKSLSSLNQFFLVLLFSFSLSLSLSFRVSTATLLYPSFKMAVLHSIWANDIKVDRAPECCREDGANDEPKRAKSWYIYIYIYFYIGSFFIYLRVYLYLSIYLCAFWFLPCKMTLIDLNKQDNRTVDGNRVASPSDTTIIIIYLFI